MAFLMERTPGEVSAAQQALCKLWHLACLVAAGQHGQGREWGGGGYRLTGWLADFASARYKSRPQAWFRA